MKLKRALILFSLLVFAFSSAHAYSGEKGIKWWKNPEIVAELKLTTDQVNRIENVFSYYKRRIVSLDSELGEKEKKLKNAIKNPNSTKEEVLRLSDEVEGIKGELRRLEVTMYLEIREVLTPDQRDRLYKIRSRYRDQKSFSR
jgi:Spy/CpxP family protein refolding chaperone